MVFRRNQTYKMMIVIRMILILLSSPFLTKQTSKTIMTANAQIIGGGNVNGPTATATIVQMRTNRYRPYGLVFLHENVTTTGSIMNDTFINITNDIINDTTNDICVTEFEYISNMLYSTYTSALLVETPLTTSILQSLDQILIDSLIFNSVAAVVDGKTNENIIIIQHTNGLSQPMSSASPTESPTTLSPTVSPSVSPSLRPIVPIVPGLRNLDIESPPVVVVVAIPSTSPTTMPSVVPSVVPTIERVIDNGVIVTTTTTIPNEYLTDNDDDDDTYVDDDLYIDDDEYTDGTNNNTHTNPIVNNTTNATLIIEVIVPQPITIPTPLPNTFTGIFTLVKADMSVGATDTAIYLGNYTNGAIVNISSFMNQKMSLSIDYKCCFTSVVFDYKSSTGIDFKTTEGGAPYSLNKNRVNDYNEVSDLSMSGLKRIIVTGYNGTNIIATLNLNFTIVGGRPNSNTDDDWDDDDNRRRNNRILESNDNDNDYEQKEVTTLSTAHNTKSTSILDNIETKQQQRRLQVFCRRSICFGSKFVIDVLGCRRYCTTVKRNRNRQLSSSSSSHKNNNDHPIERSLLTNTTTPFPNRRKRILYRKGKRNNILRGRGEVTAALFYQYVQQYIIPPTSSGSSINCQAILLSMSYIIIDLEIQS